MRNPKVVGADLRAWMEREGLSEAALCAKIARDNSEISVTQSWISRILRGKFRRYTEKVVGVLAYADIPMIEDSAPDPAGAAIINRAVSDVWNGSVPHADLIARLIRVAEHLPQPATPASQPPVRSSRRTSRIER